MGSWAWALQQLRQRQMVASRECGLSKVSMLGRLITLRGAGCELGTFDLTVFESTHEPGRYQDWRLYKPRGFAAMSPERRRELGSKGGNLSSASEAHYKFTSETAKIAAAKNDKAYRWNHDQAVIAGRKGGLRASLNRQAKRAGVK